MKQPTSPGKAIIMLNAPLNARYECKERTVYVVGRGRGALPLCPSLLLVAYHAYRF